ncbi:Gfo/Idh/MocA family protein [Jiangella muralis]|uniref:Gfo/Idh/MocA family protein n=1 Tax=Jiangella muralis TaxID=702383 RepID=UPI00069CCA7C|nr:Gfo/Idh/MocA family oxidoreductase [Jiangella muralis]
MTSTTHSGAAPATASPAVRTVRILMNGVTGRMGKNQHLIRSILAIRAAGGIAVGPGQAIMPEPVLVGRNRSKLEALAAEHGVAEVTTDLDAALREQNAEIYFDAQLTSARTDAVRRAIAAGVHLYCEKPLAPTLGQAMDIVRLANKAGIKQGIVQDKLFLPGIVKLRRVIESGALGDLLSVRGEFGYWVYPGPDPAPQRPSWNYKANEGGGIISDMFPHWQYVLEHTVGRPMAVSARGAVHLERRIDEAGAAYRADAEDAVYASFETDRGVFVQFNSSWCVRVNRDELFELQVDGTRGSAVAGLLNCKLQSAETTPRSTWNPDLPDPIAHRAGWTPVPDVAPYDNAFRAQWELFLRHVVLDEPFPWDFLAGARGIQLAEVAHESWASRRWHDIADLPT